MRVTPLLFLDVDGVLNACPPLPDVEVLQIKGFPISIPPGTKERIAKLSEAFEMVWATTWKGDAHDCFAEHIGLDSDESPWHHIDFPGTYKLPAILDYAVEVRLSGCYTRPWVWIDDRGSEELADLGLQCDSKNSLVITPDLGEGLTDAHVEQALQFYERINRERGCGE